MANFQRIFIFSTSTEPSGQAGHEHVGQKIIGALNFTEKIKNALKRSIFNGFLIFQHLRNRCAEPVTSMSVKKL